MKIKKVAVAFPSWKVTNATVFAEVERNTAMIGGKREKELKTTLELIRRALANVGTETRFWLAPGETSESVTLTACRDALASLPPGEKIDLLIYASVFSEVVEPAAANLFAHKLGLPDVECFDMKAACDGWMKAMKLAEVFIRTGHHRNILIINAEFSMVEDFAIRPHLFNLSSVDQLKWRLPIFTIGEAATATLVCPGEESQRWSSVNVTDNDAYDLCSVMAPWYRANAVDASPRLAKDRAGLFTSWAADLSARGIPLALDAFKKSAIRPQEVDILFTHASSTRDWKMIASKIGMSDKLYDIHPRYGNLVSASVPAAIALAVQDGRLKRGMNIAALVASAGMTATAASIVY